MEQGGKDREAVTVMVVRSQQLRQLEDSQISNDQRAAAAAAAARGRSSVDPIQQQRVNRVTAHWQSVANFLGSEVSSLSMFFFIINNFLNYLISNIIQI